MTPRPRRSVRARPQLTGYRTQTPAEPSDTPPPDFTAGPKTAPRAGRQGIATSKVAGVPAFPAITAPAAKRAGIRHVTPSCNSTIWPST